MKKNLDINGESVAFYSINLCSYGESGDYEIFASRELDLDIISLKKGLEEITNGKWSKQVGQFSLNDVSVTIYCEGRLIMEGVKPDTHQAAFDLLKEILSVPEP